MQRILVVTPHTLSSGEASTAIHVANHLAGHGWRVSFLASANTAKAIPSRFEISPLHGSDANENQVIWKQGLARFKPSLILFADYPLLADGGSVPLVDDAWIDSLDRLDVGLLTFDHFDLAHDRHSLPADRLLSFRLPDRMGVLLPCPIHNPSRPAGLKRVPFRYWTPLNLDTYRRSAIRARYLGGPNGLLVFHAVPRWAQALAAMTDQPLYNFMSKLLRSYLAELPDPVTVISVNDGVLLCSSTANHVTIVNRGPSMTATEFEELLTCSDLMLTENCFSVTLGKAICSLVPAILWRHTMDPLAVLTSDDNVVREIAIEMILRNPKSLNPWLAFPHWNQNMVSMLNGLIDEPGGILSTIQCLEIFGGASTRRTVRALLINELEREICRARQLAYVNRVSELPTPLQAIQMLTGV
jgi:hypothetical protein